MALMKCPECGGQVSDQADVCIHCGYPLKNHTKNIEVLGVQQKNKEIRIKNQKQDQPKEERKHKCVYKIVLGLGVVLIAIIVIFVILFPRLKYEYAKKMLSEGKYESALEVLEDIKDYKGVEKLIEEGSYQYANSLIENNKDLSKALKIYEKIPDYQESSKKMIYCNYQLGMQAYELGDFEKAIKYFEKVKDSLDVSREISCSNSMLQYQGEWFNKEKKYGIRIDGWDLYRYFYNLCEDGKYRISSELKTLQADMYTIYEKSVGFCNDTGSTDFCYYSLQNDNLHEIANNGIETTFFKEKISTEVMEKPTIGMTSEEVKNSTWGEPEDINKDTYSWGIKEQWCYPDNKYIYFEDGIVTSISE